MSGIKRPGGETPGPICSSDAERWRLADAYRRVALRELGRHWSHTLVQPIAAVHNYFGAATAVRPRAEPSESPMGELLDHMGAQIERLVECVQNLRSRLPELPLERRTVDLNAIARQAVLQRKGGLVDRGIDLNWSLARDHPHVTGDVTLLTQALINLIVNALEAMDATPRDGRQLTIASRVDEDEVWISIGDTGLGVPEEMAQRIFEPLFSTKEGALGMGLPVARAIAEAHEGHLRLEPQPAQGVRFRFSLPRLE